MNHTRLVLSIDQPYATLIMLGIKTFETRPSPPNGDMMPRPTVCDGRRFTEQWSRSAPTRTRLVCTECGKAFSRLVDGFLPDHTRPNRGLPGARVNRGDRLYIASTARPIRDKVLLGDEYEAWPADPPGKVHPNHDSERPQRLYVNGTGWPGLIAAGSWWPLPLGCILGSVTVTDAYPIVADPVARDCVDSRRDQLALRTDTPTPGRESITDISDQLPFGDWTPGRWAWALTDPQPLPEPIPATGKQGVWKWTP